MNNLLNITQWRGRGMRPKNGEEPRERRWLGMGRVAHLYDESQVQPIRKVQRRPGVAYDPTPENVLRACWTVNRTAKRYRDAASACYESGAYQFATSNRLRKERAYAAKDKAMLWLIERGELHAVGMIGTLSVWCSTRLNGAVPYTFHSTFQPNPMPTEVEDDSLFVEAKPKGAAEMRLLDAMATIEALETPQITLARSAPPSRQAYVVCWTCGESGHTSRFCPDHDDDDFGGW